MTDPEGGRVTFTSAIGWEVRDGRIAVLYTLFSPGADLTESVRPWEQAFRPRRFPPAHFRVDV